MRLRNKKAKDKEDNLSRLPDDLLLSILSKLNDLKDICVCSLVSKRFASMVTRIQTISLTLPFRDMHVEDKSIISPLPIGYKNFIAFLEKLSKLEFLYLEFPCPTNASGLQGFKWKAKCDRKRAKRAGFICVLPISVRKTIQNQREQEPESEEDYSHSYYLDFQRSRNYPDYRMFLGCSDCMHILSILIGSLRSLKSVTITDSEKYGKLIVEDEQLVMWRNSLVSKEEHLDHNLNTFFLEAFLPVLHLRSSGYMIKGVQVMIMFCAESEEVGKNDMMSWKYEGEEKIFDEALKEIFIEQNMKCSVKKGQF